MKDGYTLDLRMYPADYDMNRWEQKAEERIRHIVREELARVQEQSAVDARLGLGHDSSADGYSHDHVPVSEDVSQGRGSQPGSGGSTAGDVDRDGGIHPGSGESEYRRLDDGYVGHSLRETEARLVTIVTTDRPTREDERPTVHQETDINIGIVMTAREWAALIQEHEFEGFSRSERGRTAETVHNRIEERLACSLPEWRMLWAKRSN